jgi:hypothetical protein
MPSNWPSAPVGAAYGVGGALLAFAWLWLVRCFGLVELPVAAD